MHSKEQHWRKVLLLHGKRLEILCVEDDEDILFITAIALGLDNDMIVRVANGSPEALKILRDPTEHIACVLLDIQMPEMNGVDMLAEMRGIERHEGTPVIFLTASAREADIARYSGLDVTGTIVKPYNPMTLAATVRNILAAPH